MCQLFLSIFFVFNCTQSCHHAVPTLPFANEQEDLFTTADQARATIILAFLRTSPHPTMVRRVFRQSPKAGLAAVHLVMQPLRVTTDGLSNQAIAAAAARKAQRLESWQPLSGLESTVELLESSAGATALAVAMGIEVSRVMEWGKWAGEGRTGRANDLNSTRDSFCKSRSFCR